MFHGASKVATFFVNTVHALNYIQAIKLLAIFKMEKL